MEIEEVIPLILIIGTISLYFLITGIKGLLQKRMKVLNPLADTQAFTIQDFVFNTFKKKIESDLNIPEGFVDKSEQVEITGSGLLFRAWFHIILGVLALFVLVIFLYPKLFNRIMDLIFLS